MQCYSVDKSSMNSKQRYRELNRSKLAVCVYTKNADEMMKLKLSM